jgi:hypothetical protein
MKTSPDPPPDQPEFIRDGDNGDFLLFIPTPATEAKVQSNTIFVVFDVSGSMSIGARWKTLLEATYMIIDGHRVVVALFGDPEIDKSFKSLLEIDMTGIVDKEQFAKHVHAIILQAMIANTDFRYHRSVVSTQSIFHSGTCATSLDSCLEKVIVYSNVNEVTGVLVVLSDAELEGGKPTSIRNLVTRTNSLPIFASHGRTDNFFDRSYLLFVGEESEAQKLVDCSGIEQMVCVSPQLNLAGQLVLSPESENKIGEMFDSKRTVLAVSGLGCRLKPSGVHNARFQPKASVSVSSGSVVLFNGLLNSVDSAVSVTLEMDGETQCLVCPATLPCTSPNRFIQDLLLNRALNTLTKNTLPENLLPENVSSLDQGSLRVLFLYLLAAGKKKVRQIMGSEGLRPAQCILWTQYVTHLKQAEEIKTHQLKEAALTAQKEQKAKLDAQNRQLEELKAANLSQSDVEKQIQEATVKLEKLRADQSTLQVEWEKWKFFNELIRMLGLGTTPEETKQCPVYLHILEEAKKFQVQTETDRPVPAVIFRGGSYKRRQGPLKSAFQCQIEGSEWYQNVLVPGQTKAAKEFQAKQEEVMNIHTCIVKYKQLLNTMQNLAAVPTKVPEQEDLNVLALVNALVGMNMESDCVICYNEGVRLVKCCGVCKNTSICVDCSLKQRSAEQCFFCRSPCSL